jgi:hypothetical protein
MSTLLQRLVDREAEGFHTDEDFARDMADYILPLGDDEAGKDARLSLRIALQSAAEWHRIISDTETYSVEHLILRADALTTQTNKIGTIVLDALLASTGDSDEG